MSYTFNPTSQKVQKALRQLNSRMTMWGYLWYKLPAAAFSAVRIKQVSVEKAEVLLPYRWRSQNPFRSIYFAAQCAAAELSTGVLVLTAISDAPPISMLVVDFKASFHKKANQTLVFTCVDGQKIIQAIEQTMRTGEGVQVTATSEGCLPNGELASKMEITWSLKKKSSKK